MTDRISRMPMNTVYWRCKCGNDTNLPDSLDCKFCGKQRWSDLGVSREQAEAILCKLFPASVGA